MNIVKNLSIVGALNRPLYEKAFILWLNTFAPIIFYFGIRQKPWDLGTTDLLRMPEGSLGHALGKFYAGQNLEPIPGAELHDVYHVLFGFSTSIKEESALQFFLIGNGKNSIASLGTLLGARFLFPGSWKYFKECRQRGEQCVDLSQLDFSLLLSEDLEKVKASLIKSNAENS